MSLVNGYGAYQKYSYDTNVKNRKTKETAGTDRGGRADKAKGAEKDSGISSQVKLSEGAKKLLEELKKTYSNMDFFVADYDSDEEAQSYLSRGTKEYSVLIDPETLEAMAADSATKEKYLGIIDEATGKLSQMKEELSEEEDNVVKSIGITIDKGGNVSYFAELEKMSENQRERIQKAKEEAKSEEKEEAKRKERQAEKERLSAPREGKGPVKDQPHIPKTTQKVSLKADSAEDLLEQIRSVDWSQVKVIENQPIGARFNLSI